MSLTTARLLVDSARSRHWAFSDLVLGDGPALLFLRSRLITHVATHGAKIEGLVGTSVQYNYPIAQPTLLITTDGSILTTTYGQAITTDNGGLGTPTLGSQYQDGWPLHLTGGGVPYLDFTEPPISTDPFGLYGGNPGFALPTDMIRLTEVTLVLGSSNALVPCDIVPQIQRHTTLPGRNPAVFTNANRLVPILPTPTSAGLGIWANVTAIQISYVGLQILAALDDVLNLPSVLAEALIADLAEFMASQAKQVPPIDKARLSAEATKCGAIIGNAALDLLNSPQQKRVLYR